MYTSNCPNGALAEEQALRGYFYPLVNILGVQEVSLVVYSSSLHSSLQKWTRHLRQTVCPEDFWTGKSKYI